MRYDDYSYYRSKGQNLGCAVAALVCSILFAIVAFTASAVSKYSDPHWETVTVTEKNVNPGNNSGEKWLVYTEGEVYCITDLLWVGFFNSSDVYNSIKVGKTYKVYVSGKRWPLMSAYKVIREAEEIQE